MNLVTTVEKRQTDTTYDSPSKLNKSVTFNNQVRVREYDSSKRRSESLRSRRFDTEEEEKKSRGSCTPKSNRGFSEDYSGMYSQA